MINEVAIPPSIANFLHDAQTVSAMMDRFHLFPLSPKSDPSHHLPTDALLSSLHKNCMASVQLIRPEMLKSNHGKVQGHISEFSHALELVLHSLDLIFRDPAYGDYSRRELDSGRPINSPKNRYLEELNRLRQNLLVVVAKAFSFKELTIEFKQTIMKWLDKGRFLNDYRGHIRKFSRPTRYEIVSNSNFNEVQSRRDQRSLTLSKVGLK